MCGDSKPIRLLSGAVEALLFLALVAVYGWLITSSDSCDMVSKGDERGQPAVAEAPVVTLPPASPHRLSQTRTAVADADFHSEAFTSAKPLTTPDPVTRVARVALAEMTGLSEEPAFEHADAAANRPPADRGGSDAYDDGITPLIARAAGHRLNLLTERYALTDGQRTGIFHAYACGAAASFGVNVSAGESATPAVDGGEASVDLATLAPDDAAAEIEEAVYDELTPEQQEQYVDEAVDRDLWWTEIIGQLQGDLVADIAAPTEPGSEPGDDAPQTPTDEPAAGGDSESHAGGNLFNLLGL